jgi:hypothetical protein
VIFGGVATFPQLFCARDVPAHVVIHNTIANILTLFMMSPLLGQQNESAALCDRSIATKNLLLSRRERSPWQD